MNYNGVSYVRYKIVAVDIYGGKDQTGHEYNQAKRQAAQAVEGRLLGPQRQDQFLLILKKSTYRAQALILQKKKKKKAE